MVEGNNYKQQAEVFDELVTLAQVTSVDKLVQSKNLPEFLRAIGQLTINTINNDIQRMCLKFVQIYFRALAKLAASSTTATSKYVQFADVKINECLLEYLIVSSVTIKQVLHKQLAIDVIYTYMRMTDDLNACFLKFVKFGIEAGGNNEASKQFIDSTLIILINEEFASRADSFAPLVHALIRQSQANPRCESGAQRCLTKIESIVKRDKFNAFVSKLPQAVRNPYLAKRGGSQFKNSLSP